MKRRTFVSGLASAIGFCLAGKAGQPPGPLEKVTLRFNWSWIGNYAPVVLGRERGFYREVGIDLILGQGKGSGATVRQAGAKNDMFVWADTSALLVAGAQDLPVKAVMVLARSNLGLVWLEDRTTIRTAQDLKGKKISATPGDGNTQLWPAVLAANHLTARDVEVVYLDAAAAVAALRAGRTDVAFCGISDQPVTLRNAGLKARAVTFSDWGVATLGSALITHADVISARPELVRRMVAATQRSWLAALQEPDAAAQALVRIADTPLNFKLLRESLLVFQGLATKTEPLGFIEPSAMQDSLDLLKQYGGVRTNLPATAFYSNAFVGI